MLVNHVALVSLSKKVSAAALAQTAAALQKQVTRDLGPIWSLSATVDSFPDLKSIPPGYWPVIITENIKDPGAAGYHNDKNNQPYSLVQFDDSWQLTCSHETCEMLVDPYGNRTQSAGSPDPKQGKVNFLVEVCDPCEDASFGYSINGILLSDFYTPSYFDPQPVGGVRYSFTGSITKPGQVLKNGYLSWQDPASKGWFQQTYFSAKPVIKPLPAMNANRTQSLRSQMDRITKNPNLLKSYQAAAKKHQPIQDHVFNSGISHSESWKRELSKFVKPGKNLTESPILVPASVGCTFKNGNADQDFLNVTLLDDTGQQVGTGSIGKGKPGPVKFDNAPPGFRITTDGFCLGTAVISIDIPTSPRPASSYGPGRFGPSFDC
jgi:hypothetical protein